jgi:hypothetical protein
MSALSRRSLVTSAAALPALALPAVAVGAVVADDDTLARIAKHRRLNDLEGDICSRMSGLERALPKERRKMSNVCDRGTDLGKDDDPRWTAINDEYWATVEAKDKLVPGIRLE